MQNASPTGIYWSLYINYCIHVHAKCDPDEINWKALSQRCIYVLSPLNFWVPITLFAARNWYQYLRIDNRRSLEKAWYVTADNWLQFYSRSTFRRSLSETEHDPALWHALTRVLGALIPDCLYSARLKREPVGRQKRQFQVVFLYFVRQLPPLPCQTFHQWRQVTPLRAYFATGAAASNEFRPTTARQGWGKTGATLH